MPSKPIKASRADEFQSTASDAYHDVNSVEELTARNVQAIVGLEAAAKAQRTKGAQMAHAVSGFCGSIRFVWIHVVWFGGWVLFNTLPGMPHVDPFPFQLLTLIVSLEAIFLSAFILISQNEETRMSERRNALDLQINLLTEQENTKMLSMLEKIAEKVGVTGLKDDPALAVLEQAMRPDRLAAQIDQATG